jgi:hypothetical protein
MNDASHTGRTSEWEAVMQAEDLAGRAPDRPGKAEVAQLPTEADVGNSQRVVDIVITPSPTQYRQLVQDLDVLREAGAQTNTEAIVNAIRRVVAALPSSEVSSGRPNA